ncbi:MAG: membrane fusion protein (multidrug efflux system) [Bradymonadia bacterium]|jgi:membrane fusion protein (multidrug efflux system)
MYQIRLFALAIGLSSLAGCAHERHHEEAVPTFPVTTPLRQDAEIKDEYVARVHAIQHIELRALERGYLTDIFVDEGQLISKGAKMFQILPRIYDAELRRAKAEQKMATIELKNTRMLAEKKIVAAPQLAMAEAKLAKAKAERSLAQTHRNLTRISAPFTGLMGRFEVRLGSLLDEGELLTTLSDNSTVWVYFNVSEADYLNLKAKPNGETGVPVELRMANGELFDQPGKIETIEADFNRETGNIAFRAAFPNPTGLLRHGETGNILLKHAYPGALLIPQSATYEILDRRFVFVVDDAGLVKQRRIKVAAELPHIFVIESGLKSSETFLLDGLRKVRDGQTIEFEIKDPATVMAGLEPPAE